MLLLFFFSFLFSFFSSLRPPAVAHDHTYMNPGVEATLLQGAMVYRQRMTSPSSDSSSSDSSTSSSSLSSSSSSSSGNVSDVNGSSKNANEVALQAMPANQSQFDRERSTSTGPAAMEVSVAEGSDNRDVEAEGKLQPAHGKNAEGEKSKLKEKEVVSRSRESRRCVLCSQEGDANCNVSGCNIH